MFSTLIGRDSDVKLTVYHRNVLGLDEFLGQTSIPLAGIENFDRAFTRYHFIFLVLFVFTVVQTH